MYVCICHSVTDGDIKNAVSNGITSVDGLSDTLGVGTCCGSCMSFAQDLISEAVAEYGQANELFLYESEQ